MSLDKRCIVIGAGVAGAACARALVDRGWQVKLLDIAKNGYRVILTRARKGMVIFVPKGDPSGDDPTRNAAFYDGVAAFLLACGAQELADGEGEKV